MSYNGWANRETWLVYLWYGNDLADMLSEDGDRVEAGIDEQEAEEWVRYVAEESEMLSQPPKSGLLSDFLEMCWSEVDWREVAEHLTEDMKEIASA
jgi:hypothetical protein